MRKRRERNSADQRRAYYWDRVRKYCDQYKNFSWPSTELILNLVYTYGVFQSHSLQVFSRFNLSVSAINILMILNFGEHRGYKQQELSHLLLVSRANITKVIDGMEKRGLVMRNASQEDRRARFIKLTGAGKALANQLIPIQNKKSVKITASLSRKEINTLNKLLAKLSTNIIESEKEK